MKRKFFLRRVAIYLAMMLIPMLLLLTAFVVMNLKEIDHSLKEQGKQTIEAVDVNFSLVLSNVLYQNDLLTSTTRMNISLDRILALDEMTYADSINISSLRSILNSIQESHEYVDSIYIYIDKSERYFASDKGIYQVNHSSDRSWMETYQQMDQEHYIEQRIIEQGSSKEKKVITVYKHLLLKTGCIIVNLNMEKLEDILGKQLPDESEIVYLVNQNGEILARCSNEEEGQLDDQYFIRLKQKHGDNWRKIFQEQKGKWLDIDGRKVLINSGEYNEMDVTYVSVIPETTKNARVFSMMSYFIAFISIDLIVVIFLAYLTTKRSFDQIADVIDMFDEAEKKGLVSVPEKRNRDEYDVIMNNVIYMFLNTNHLNLQLKENEFKRERAEMMALQLQINPHFLFNTLQTIEIEVRERYNKEEEVSSTIRDLSEILKYSLSDPARPVTVADELKYLKKYISIQKFRFGNQFIIYYEVDEQLLDTEVFRLFLQPLVENSIMHGIRKKAQRGYIKVSIRHQEDMIRCCVMDTGKGMSREELRKLREKISDDNSQGIGLANLYRRLLLRYGKQSTLRIWSKEGMGTAIIFYIPYQQD